MQSSLEVVGNINSYVWGIKKWLGICIILAGSHDLKLGVPFGNTMANKSYAQVVTMIFGHIHLNKMTPKY